MKFLKRILSPLIRFNHGIVAFQKKHPVWDFVMHLLFVALIFVVYSLVVFDTPALDFDLISMFANSSEGDFCTSISHYSGFLWGMIYCFIMSPRNVKPED